MLAEAAAEVRAARPEAGARVAVVPRVAAQAAAVLAAAVKVVAVLAAAPEATVVPAAAAVEVKVAVVRGLAAAAGADRFDPRFDRNPMRLAA